GYLMDRIKIGFFSIVIIPLALAVFCPQSVAGSEETSSPLPPLTDAEVREQMRLTIGRTALPEGIEPEKLDYLLKKGQMVIIDEMIDEVPWLLSVGIPVDAPVDDVWKVISDFENYNKWVPSCKSTVVTHHGENIVEIGFTLGFKFIFIPLYVKYTNRHYHQSPLRSDWTGLGGDIEKNCGWFQNIPVSENNSLFFYSNWTLPGSGLLKKMYEKYPFLDVGIGMSAATVYTRKLKDRVESIKGPGKLEGEQEVKSPVQPLSREEEQGIMQLLSARGAVLQFEEMEEEGKMGMSSWITIDAPRNKVWEEIINYSSYEYFMPMMKKIKILEMKEDRVLVEFKFEADIVVFSARPKYVSEYHFIKPEKITWSTIKGDKYVVNGSWEFFPIEEGKKTLACYRNVYDVKSLGFLIKTIMKVLPEGQLAVNSYVTQKTVRDMRDWIETPPDMKERIKTIKSENKRERAWDVWTGELRKERLKRR
ncbi:MAG: SRPBCC family protein, partial [Deltaproteobacteria bacterium]